LAADEGHIEVVKYLVEQGAPIDVAKRHGTDAVKDFCKAYELRKMLGQKLGSHTPSKSKSPRLKI
ncbi:ankyrin repeat domain-containing protein, partial [Bordetella hinzii]|uniref:ankyrin repeat domain-containing protein n=1 Tax=Bordetella hinzii TaxID=103855 RepID=UPI001E4305EA